MPNNKGGIEIDVKLNGIDEAIKKAKELRECLEDIKKTAQEIKIITSNENTSDVITKKLFVDGKLFSEEIIRNHD